MATKAAYHETQYLGRDYYRISIRAVMILFCIAAYYITEGRERNGDLFLLVGALIFVASILMLFMVHYRTIVQNKSVVLNGLWTTKLVKIDLNSIVKVTQKPYSPFLINNPVYNLHQKGKIRFYASGKDAVSLIDRDGLEYIIGTQHPRELEAAIKKEMAS
ncbi:hypothetical protein [Pedobacter sp. SYSU D00535]|uniref:hypothetical protein n=1 Tax=Pedobacter sp. SYSU D00535 TaxID=2810308 RepID=UPI001A95DA13|nr:hypothetical protein [Pedobacter sp. SYSU D00535]